MGFVLQRKSYKLTFGEGTVLEGATVVMGGMTLGEAELLNSQPEDLNDGQQVQENFDKKLALMASRVQSWDLEDDQGPLPTTVDGLKRLELGEMLEMQRAWAAAATAVAVPLPSASSGGETPPPLEVSIPTETLSASPESSPTPSSS